MQSEAETWAPRESLLSPRTSFVPSGVRMKIAFAVTALLIACLMAEGGLAQSSSSSRFQSVGEDYGKAFLGTLRTTNPVPASSNNSSLWSWGSSPKGTSILDGGLVGDPKYAMRKLNIVNNWLGDSFVDPYGTPEYSFTDSVTGAPVRVFVDSITGQYYYTYVDSTSKKTVYVYFNPETGIPFDASFTPPAGASTAAMNAGTNVGTNYGTNYGTNANAGGMTTPSVYGSNDPWSQGL